MKNSSTCLEENITDWNVIYTYPKFEKKIYQGLKNKKIESYLPLQKIVRQWSDRKKKIETPLIPNYIFVRVTNREIGSVLELPGVVKFLKNNGNMSIVSNNEVESIRMILNGTYNISLEENFVKGDRVKIQTGPFAGLEGIVCKKNGKSRFIVEISGINKAFSVNVPLAYLVVK